MAVVGSAEKEEAANYQKGVTSDTFGPKGLSIIHFREKNSKREIARLNDIFNLNISVVAYKIVKQNRIKRKRNEQIEQNKEWVLHTMKLATTVKVNLVGFGMFAITQVL
ncbi:hypothetical protein TNIN_54641 [Trichonephila inaurata madagascariensis]|uniref:Uncharacterized protein n=1 Tax=Trichonephila inaurata madagascariensis TaxID=2747483 RepID=A0A8X6YXH9_9ARAC|nr:hypothetical protein TNIN_54641 [Trichonephila inaurata madagascariensis]